jgi:hypothetical protein
MAAARIRAILPVALLWLAASCGGGGSGSGGGSGGSGGGGTTPPPNQNPCATAALEAEDNPAEPGTSAPRKRNPLDTSSRWRVLDSLWLHRQAELMRARTPLPSATADAPGIGRPAADVGEIAVVQDEGDVVLPANQYDLRNIGLKFTRNGSGGYDVARIDATFRQSLGTRQTLTDDDSVNVNVAFPFSFYGTAHTTAFVNSDGNITFEEEDKASTERNVARLLTGPPRVAPSLADLDPTIGSGRIYVNAASDQYTVTWCNVRAFDSTLTITMQLTLLPDGSIEFKYENVTIGNGVVGVSPGFTAVFSPVDLSAAPVGGGSGAVGERFAVLPEVDTVALTRKFYQSHPDSYDQLVVWTDQRYTQSGAFAYEQTIANEIRGIGVPVYDLSRDFGSGGRLRSMAFMDFVGKYPDDPATKFLGENNTVSVLGQEAGHRWLAFVDFRNHLGQRSDALLGRDQSHWSFFFDSDASVMEGNDIEDLGGGRFRTAAAVQRYSLLDQYMMGAIPPSQVGTFFYVESPTNISPIRDRDDAPQVGVMFSGTKREVLIQDIVAVHGDRSPTSAQTNKVHRQAFIYLVTAGRSQDAAQISKVDRIRQQWESFFQQATSGRMTADTRLR